MIEPGVIGRLLHHDVAGLEVTVLSSSIMSISPDMMMA
jgi:hypothetical protein